MARFFLNIKFLRSKETQWGNLEINSIAVSLTRLDKRINSNNGIWKIRTRKNDIEKTPMNIRQFIKLKKV